MEVLTNLLPSTPLTGNSSMVAGNGISDESGAMTAPGTESEQTAQNEARQPTGPSNDGAEDMAPLDHGADYNPAYLDWKTLPQNGYTIKEMG